MWLITHITDIHKHTENNQQTTGGFEGNCQNVISKWQDYESSII